MFPASYGDAFLVRCVSADQTTNILIDSGTTETYRQHIRSRLLDLKNSGQHLSTLIVTHVDSDHIEGAIALLAENGAAHAPQIIQIDDVWHNSYRHLPLTGRPPTVEETNRVISQLSVTTRSADGNISARHGSTLAALLRRHGYSWNRLFGGSAILAPESGILRVSLGPDIHATILSPLQSHLQSLARHWRRELLMLGVSHEAVDSADFESAFEAALLKEIDDDADEPTSISSSSLRTPPDPASFREDRSITNGSSIALLLEFAGLRALFLGDAFPSTIADQLQLLHPSPAAPIFDLVKISHHGSKRSTSPTLLTRLQSKTFLISTDGKKHNHPDMETLLWIAASQPKGSSLVFNHETPESKAIQDPEIKKRYGQIVHVASGTEPVVLTFQGKL
ncbi:AVAST type 1 anti-phage system MBL fold metallo-hydrolase Avs1a [Pyxidicoccus caerfyrddinensis]|uniref:AVAST type 1 anti-phage system MBL fold metallo-hydrolase Avs1a n=1 Tax=Pyxidicoccus caerfyrddinensis TaxID=2709663 RepID=UPI0013DD1AC8|nr:AVAST type 1 anti-phage system MBL fold metallo-hydrolase Avs1a [Pyxidicoccus caerfyrddinensis]